MNDSFDSFVSENSESKEKILFRCYDNFSSMPYALSLQQTIITSKTLGIKVEQKVDAFNYYTDTVDVSQSMTSSRYIKVFSRFYDDKKRIKYYLANDKEEINNKIAKPIFLSYDEYIKKFGKLYKRKYFVKKESQLVNENSNEVFTEDEENSSLRYGISIYEINDFSYKKADIVKKGKNYLLSFVLDPLASHVFFSKQIKNTGHLTDNPVFFSSSISFLIDRDFNLINSVSSDRYKAKFGLLSLDITMVTKTSFFTSFDNTFTSGRKKIQIKIPKEDDVYFDGYRLL